MSSTVDAAGAAMEARAEVDRTVCANCGVPEVDDIKLEECTDCDVVKYCTDNCRENHREQHEDHCNKRKAELHDKKLFTQSDISHLGECPICFLPLPLDKSQSMFWSCCCERICDGCVLANAMANRDDEMKVRRCPFCRETANVDDDDDDDEDRKRVMKRVKANDPAALCFEGKNRYDEGDYGSALEYLTKAAELGDVVAHYELSYMYYKGHGVEMDKEKMVYHLEEAAIGGHPYARHSLAYLEEEIGNAERAVKHLIIAANIGHDLSMKALWKHYSRGNITKEDLDATLRKHHAALEGMKSSHREEADVVFARDA
jgi:hypothetical protein